MKFKFINFEKIIEMRNLKYTILIVIFSLVACVVNAQRIEKRGIWDYPGKPDLWDYPVKPGTEEWKNFQSNEEMVNSCQIPEKVLSDLPTEELTELCLQYPLIYDVFAFDNLNSGLDKLFSDFNGISVLYQRNDVLNCIIKRYALKVQSFSFLDEINTDYEKGEFIVDVSLLEVLLSRCVVHNDATNEAYKDVLPINQIES